MVRIVVLGGGLVGHAIARDFQNDGYEVVIADKSETRVSFLKEKYGLDSVVLDVTDQVSLESIINDADLVISAVPGFLGHSTLKKVINAGKNIVDISFSEQDPMRLHEQAVKKNVTAVVDAGFAPGLSNIIAGREYVRMSHVERFVCYVGGLPIERVLPFEYKAPFSPVDVIEEYTREVTYMENGVIMKKPGLSDLEHIEIPGIGTLEAFNTDGLRTLLTTLKIPNMIEKTLRYPGHVEKIMLLKDLGFLDKQEITMNNVLVKPVDVTVKLLEKYWTMQPEDKDLTVMKVRVEGMIHDEHVTREYMLYDEFDEATKTSSMARTTGYTAAIIGRMILQGRLQETGVVPPENVGMKPELFSFLLRELRKRGVHIQVP